MSTPTVPLSVLLRVRQALDSAQGITAQPEAVALRISQQLAEANGALSYYLDKIVNPQAACVEVEA